MNRPCSHAAALFYLVKHKVIDWIPWAASYKVRIFKVYFLITGEKNLSIGIWDMKKTASTGATIVV